MARAMMAPFASIRAQAGVNAHRRWTQSDITTLRDQAVAGGTLANVADALQRAPGDVVAMMRRLRLGFDLLPLTDEKSRSE